MYLGILPQSNGSIMVVNACHVSISGSYAGEPLHRQRFPLSPQQTCQIHGICPDQVYLTDMLPTTIWLTWSKVLWEKVDPSVCIT